MTLKSTDNKKREKISGVPEWQALATAHLWFNYAFYFFNRTSYGVLKSG